jgi:hypothetical protein
MLRKLRPWWISAAGRFFAEFALKEVQGEKANHCRLDSTKISNDFNRQARLESGKCGCDFNASLKRRQNFYYSFSQLRFFDRFGNAARRAPAPA